MCVWSEVRQAGRIQCWSHDSARCWLADEFHDLWPGCDDRLIFTPSTIWRPCSFFLLSFFLSFFPVLLNCIFSYLVFVDFWLVCSLFSFNFSSLQRLFHWREYWQIIITACVSLNTWSQQKKTNNWLWTAFQKNNIERCTQIEKCGHQSISFSFFFVRGVHLKENHAAAFSPPPFTAWALSCVSPHQ